MFAEVMAAGGLATTTGFAIVAIVFIVRWAHGIIEIKDLEVAAEKTTESLKEVTEDRDRGVEDNESLTAALALAREKLDELDTDGSVAVDDLRGGVSVPPAGDGDGKPELPKDGSGATTLP